MFEKGKRERRNKEDDAVFNRMLLWLAGAVGVELIILLLQKMYVEMLFGAEVAAGMKGFFQVFAVAGAVAAVGAVVWAVLSSRSGKSTVLPLAVAGGAALLWIISLVSYFLYDEGMRILMMLPAAGAVLILIFFLYQRPFFFNALLTGGGLLALWMHRRYYMDHPKMITAGIVAGVLILAAVAALTFQLRKTDGKLGPIRVVPVGSNYMMTWITCGVTAAAMVLALLLDVSMSLFLLFALVGWLFAQAVFFTVKMM